jgi:GT2 family glycosyltransferase
MLIARPEVAYCFTELRFVLDAGVSRPAWTRPEQFERDHVAYLPSSMMVRASALRQVGLFEVGREVGEDTDWFFRARDAGLSMAVVPERLVLKHVHDANVSARVADSHRAILDAVRRSMRHRRAAASPTTDEDLEHGS